MKAIEVIDIILTRFEDIVPKSSWGEISLFYNPGGQLPNGIYFCTFKEKNGENDKSSNLDRENIYRMSIGLTKKSYQKHFGDKPKRPFKGDIIETNHNFTATDELMPHPIYGWMSWAQILNPTSEKLEEIMPLIAEAYQSAVIKFNKKVSS